MYRKVLFSLIALAILCCFSMPVLAQDYEWGDYTVMLLENGAGIIDDPGMVVTFEIFTNAALNQSYFLDVNVVNGFATHNFTMVYGWIPHFDQAASAGNMLWEYFAGEVFTDAEDHFAILTLEPN